jgi:hypothetical protein
VWLFPLTYAVHLTEEYLVAGGFTLWAERALAIRIGDAQFLAWNACAFALMCVGALLVGRDARFRFIDVALATAVLGNVAAHVAASLVTWTYSPGVVTGLGVWMPLAVLRLPRAYRASTPRARRAAGFLGITVVLVTLAILFYGRSSVSR